VYKWQTQDQKSFLLEVADYCTGMTLEETHEEDNIGAADEDDGPSPPTPHAPRRGPVGRLSGYMKKHQLQEIVGVGGNKYPQKPCRVCAAHRKRKNTRYICNTCKVPLRKEDFL
jgi:hypothetical protein